MWHPDASGPSVVQIGLIAAGAAAPHVVKQSFRNTFDGVVTFIDVVHPESFYRTTAAESSSRLKAPDDGGTMSASNNDASLPLTISPGRGVST